MQGPKKFLRRNFKAIVIWFMVALFLGSLIPQFLLAFQ
jgi:hypothetical protein